jgi:hypothetical protein
LHNIYQCNYHNSGHHPFSCLLFKTRRFGDWILSPTSGRSTQVLLKIEPVPVSELGVGTTSPRRQNPVSETSYFNKRQDDGDDQNCDSYMNTPSSQTYRSYIRVYCDAKEYLVTNSVNRNGINNWMNEWMNKWMNVEFYILTAVVIKSAIVYYLIPCSPFNANKHFEGLWMFLRNAVWLSTNYKVLYPKIY